MRPPLEERKTTVQPLDSANCTTSDTTVIDFTSAQVMARCQSTEQTTEVFLTVVPRTTDPGDYLRELSVRFCGDLMEAGGPSGWITEIDREEGRASVAARVTWELQDNGSPPSPRRTVGFRVRLRGEWRRGLGYSVAFSESGGPTVISPHDCPYP